MFGYVGAGVYQTEARLGDEGTGLADATADSRRYRVYAEQTDDDTPSNMPGSGLSTFYPEFGKTAGRG